MRTTSVILASLGAMVLTLLPVAGSADEPAGPPAGLPEVAAAPADDAARAQEALAQARALFGRYDGRNRGLAGQESGPARELGRDVTLVLRDLAVRVGDLEGDDRTAARRILARPTDGAADPIQNGYEAGVPVQEACSTSFCLHWVESTADAADPQWVDTQVRPVMEQVWKGVTGDLGYRAPKRDDRGVDNDTDRPKLDIYLANLRDDKMYGYCTTDDFSGGRARSAYCVLDNDFVNYPKSPEASLRVTAAHEFFHAVQFNYDIFEDAWFMEGTAAWIEDELYDGINDNRQYLTRSGLRIPEAPLDFPGTEQDPTFVYGSWIFWRYLSERFGKGASSDPRIVRQVWDRATKPGYYSLRALRATLAARNAQFPQVFTDFGVTNRRARQWYEEGRSYRNAPVRRTFTLSPTNDLVGLRPGAAVEKNRPWRIWHLANHHARFRAGTAVRGAARLRVSVDAPPTTRGSRATVMVHRKNGSVGRTTVRLNRQGNGVVTTPFTRSKVSSVVLTLTNASTRSRCNRGTGWSCQGIPLDDDLPFSFTARLLR
ncbi:MAG TPA: MXAN_6640 family putative metalloprotease [Nocardioidaceae bacterium]|nr:MXAN_6640 family putative metalloprotease [Nocardioidaceae bacterium]